MTEHDPAAGRHFVISLVRLSGVAMLMLGLLGINDVLPIPDPFNYALIVIGLVDFFVFPLLLARRWSTRER